MSTLRRPALSDLADPAVLPDPYPVLAGLREASPFAELDGAFVVAAKHADCSAVLRHPNASSERDKSLLTPQASRRRNRPSFLSLDPPDHTRLRRLVSRLHPATPSPNQSASCCKRSGATTCHRTRVCGPSAIGQAASVHLEHAQYWSSRLPGGVRLHRRL